MNITFTIEIDGNEYIVDGRFTPSDSGDRWTPPSGDEWELESMKSSFSGKEVSDAFYYRYEDEVWEAARNAFENQVQTEPDDE